jgi:GDP-L-fucose synthase
MEKEDRIAVLGQTGMIVSAMARRLKEEEYHNVILRTPADSELTDPSAVFSFFITEKPDYVFLTSVSMGGIFANKTYPAELIYQNIQAQTNVIHTAWKVGVKKLLYLGSSCSYPRESPQPMKEEYLLSGRLEPTSESYAVAKIAGIKMCQAYQRQYHANFITAIPSDLYGPEDDFDHETSHVLPALLRRMHQAKVSRQREVVVWGSGAPRREFLYVDDLADACIFLMNNYDQAEPLNIGSGEDISIGELAQLVKEMVGFRGEIVFDRTKPDGALRKYLDTAKIRGMGWQPRTGLREGLWLTYQWYLQHCVSPGAGAAGKPERAADSRQA